MRAITLAEANRIIAGTFASGRKRKAHALAAIVLDAGGRVEAFQKQDGASLMRFEIAILGSSLPHIRLAQALSRAVEQSGGVRSIGVGIPLTMRLLSGEWVCRQVRRPWLPTWRAGVS